MPTVTTYPIRDARIYEPNLGAGRSNWLPIGLSSGSIYRTLIKFAMPDWNGLGISKITDVSFKARQTSQNYIARGSSPRFYIQRLTENFADGGDSVGLSTSNAVTWSNQPSSTTSGRSDSGTLADVNDSTFLVSNAELIAMGKRWAPSTVEGGGGETHYGVKLVSYDESSTTRTTEIYAKEASVYDPRLVWAYETNTAPNAPVNRSPVSDAEGNPTIAPKSGSTVTFSFTRSDSDPGDIITKYDLEIYGDAVTDATPPSALNRLISYSYPSGGASTGEAKTTYAAFVNVSSLTAGTTYRWRVRTYDKEGAVGAWSSLNDARFIPNTVPGPPTSPSVDTNSLTPNFYGSISDPDPGATITGAQVQVYQDTSAGSVAKWNDDPDEDGSDYVVIGGGTRATVPYGGSGSLEWGVKYRYRIRLKDNVGSWGAWTNWIEWTPTEVTGPTAMSPTSIETKLNSLSPTLTIGNGAAFDQYEVEVYRYNDLSSTRHYASGTTSVASTTSTGKVVGPLPDWGRVYWWRARVRPTGGGSITLQPWSPLYPIYVNALPAAPLLSLG